MPRTAGEHEAHPAHAAGGSPRAFLRGGGGGATCAADGGSSIYIETIDESGSVPVRRIQYSGCPNHESYCTGKPGRSCGDEGKTSTLVEGTEQCDEVSVPAYPKLKSSQPDPKELDCTMGTIAYASSESRGTPRNQ